MAKTKLIPGFRFHPTDVELVEYFLKRKVIGKKFPLQVIAELEVYKYAPWDLPDKSIMSTVDLEWYFFCPRSKKNMTGGRTNRSTEAGYWKTTGRDKPIWHKNQSVGLMKVLVFHAGRPPRGDRTDWVMHEFRLHDDKDLGDKGIAQDSSYVLCRVFKKDGRGPRNNGRKYCELFDEENWDDEEDSTSIADHEPSLRVLPGIAHNNNNNNLSPCEFNWSPTPKSSLSSGTTYDPSVVNKDNVVSPIPREEDDVLCLLDSCSEEEIHNRLALSNEDHNIEAGVNSAEEKESERFPFDDIFRDLEELTNLAALDNEDYGLTQVGFPTNPS
ncbi:hypothetical protein QN277_006472 [Acacia crassicarpa]|uniref:NAC domain-containing protein n=1 Tax=Acacia crassicarpa TaxID=499986 RepID=A0AAE1M7U9_9FABA|nr:hypothetical protein QN277_006472 [Acacia crassicarpa]